MAGDFEIRDGGKPFVPAPIARATARLSVVADCNKRCVFAIGTAAQRLLTE